MPTLSLIMIVKNEEQHLANCLGSVRDIVDEMVVADTGSTDQTVAIAESFGARVVHIPWTNDFAAARNAGMAHATGDWLFVMDADEMLDQEGAQRLHALVDADGAPLPPTLDGTKADAITMKQANYSDLATSWRWVAVEPGDPWARGRSGYLVVDHLRLFRSGRGFAFREAVHESILESIQEVGGVVRQEDILIHHYGLPELDAPMPPKELMYLEIEREKVRKNPKNAKAWLDLGFQLINVDPAEAEQALRTVLTLEPRHIDALSSLAGMLMEQNRFEEARQVLEPVVMAPEPPIPLVVDLTAIYIRLGETVKAEVLLRAVIGQTPENLLARLHYARLLDMDGKMDQAAIHLEKAVGIAPTLAWVRGRRDAQVMRVKAEEQFIADAAPKTVLAQLVAALKVDPEDPVIYNDTGVLFNALGMREDARIAFQRALRLAPGFKSAQENLAALDIGAGTRKA